jgi:hypothetical protein
LGEFLNIGSVSFLSLLAAKALAGDKNAKAGYLELLFSGASDYPIACFKRPEWT